jgi:hypothetical protein
MTRLKTFERVFEEERTFRQVPNMKALHTLALAHFTVPHTCVTPKNVVHSKSGKSMT